MGRRREKRASVTLPVKVYGTDDQGHPFVQSATTLNVSLGGLRLNGIGCIRGAGGLVSVEHRNRRGDFRVVWVGENGTSIEGQIGLRSLNPDNFIFPIELPAAVPDTRSR